MYFIAARIVNLETYELAAVSVWVNDDSPEQAKNRAERFLSEHGWQLRDILDEHTIQNSDYDPGDENLHYLEQAKIDGEVCLIYRVAKKAREYRRPPRQF